MREVMKLRRSTVYGTSPPLRTTHVEYTVAETPPVPALRLRGRWLAQAGFDIGAQIEIIVTEGELVLRVLSDRGASTAERVDAGVYRGAYL
jgi:hypothetical protein